MSLRNKKNNRKGFTLIEVMVSLMILSVGIVYILKSYIVSLERTTHITNRIYATTALDNRISYIQRMLKAYKMLPIDLNRKEDIKVGGKNITFKQYMVIKEVAEMPEVFDLTLTLSWQEGLRNISLSRSAYLADFKVDQE
ncbi:MAG: prepilin-type N-terminal cleavage/methylation domain-containing protein [Candidatus Omnitrophica bacterium]|nr:prepilin-type N-terminal cleavage/methylation domain-containing protein [Candidatus Omnitrophota bacterium]